MKKLFTLLLTCCACLAVHAQAWNIGIHAGGAAYSGDLSQSFVHLNETKFAGGVFIKNQFSESLSYRLRYTYGHVSGADANADGTVDGLARQARNLSFRSKISEIVLTLEYNLFTTTIKQYPLDVYVFAGAGLLDFKPQANFNDTWYDLQPLGTEGQGVDGNNSHYKTKSMVFPVGFGVQWAPNANWTVGIDSGVRFTNTDYLDDVSGFYVDNTLLMNEGGVLAAHLADRSGEAGLINPADNVGTRRGDESKRDMYMTSALTIGYNFGISGGSKVGCPNMIF